MDEKQIKTKTAEQALTSLMRLCSRGERSSGDAMRLMSRWGVEPRERAKVLSQLIEMRFIDDRRYTEAFVRDKLRFSGWGSYKICAGLRAKGISREIIDSAMSSLQPTELTSRLATYLERKNRQIKTDNPYDRKAKLVRYGLSLGFEYDDVIGAVEKFREAKTED